MSKHLRCQEAPCPFLLCSKHVHLLVPAFCVVRVCSSLHRRCTATTCCACPYKATTGQEDARQLLAVPRNYAHAKRCTATTGYGTASRGKKMHVLRTQQSETEDLCVQPLAVSCVTHTNITAYTQVEANTRAPTGQLV